MSVKLFKNTEGKVLMSAGGKLIKQSYDFGKAFQNTMGLDNYIQVAGLSFLSSYNYLTFCNIVQTQGITRSWITIHSGANYYSHNQSTNGFCSVSYNAISNHGQDLGGITFSGVGGFFCSLFSIPNDTSFLKMNNLTNTYTGPRAVNRSIDKITIGLFILAASNAVNKYNRVLVFNRDLSTSEFLYFYNNKNGNDPQSSVGIVLDLHNNFAEILDFSPLQNGSDMRIGCRDYSGFNRHGEIINIPAGDLTTKLAWANANLFVDFLN